MASDILSKSMLLSRSLAGRLALLPGRSSLQPQHIIKLSILPPSPLPAPILYSRSLRSLPSRNVPVVPEWAAVTHQLVPATLSPVWPLQGSSLSSFPLLGPAFATALHAKDWYHHTQGLRTSVTCPEKHLIQLITPYTQHPPPPGPRPVVFNLPHAMAL